MLLQRRKITKQLSRICTLFLEHNGIILCTITGPSLTVTTLGLVCLEHLHSVLTPRLPIYTVISYLFAVRSPLLDFYNRGQQFMVSRCICGIQRLSMKKQELSDTSLHAIPAVNVRILIVSVLWGSIIYIMYLKNTANQTHACMWTLSYNISHRDINVLWSSQLFHLPRLCECLKTSCAPERDREL